MRRIMGRRGLIKRKEGERKGRGGAKEEVEIE